MGEYFGFIELFVTLIGVAVRFVYTTLKEKDQSNFDDLLGKIVTLEKNLSRRLESLDKTLHDANKNNKVEILNRVDKFEETSKRDDEMVKELIKESEGRMREEISARIRNIVELHQKIEGILTLTTSKHEMLLDRVAKLEAKVDCKDSK